MQRLRRSGYAWAKRLVPKWLTGSMGQGGDSAARALPSYEYLSRLMERYRVEGLVGVDRAGFRARIESLLDIRDHLGEGYADPSKQRDLSVRFHWGHDHDFGDFKLPGRMGDRHLTLIATFIDRLGVLPRSLVGKRILDVGSWTGGTSLLLCAMGAEVVAVEEVRKYAACLTFLKESFDLSGLSAKNLSLYQCTGREFDDSFDYVLFAGVLYHVTDPILALRIVFNALKDGGLCLLETAMVGSGRRVLDYQGPGQVLGGSAEDLSRSGWNWFVPSLTALEQMMRDVGFADVRTIPSLGSRAFAVGLREKHVDMLRSGLSNRDVR